MGNELLHVWMLTYNHEPYIAQAIESYLMQKTTFRTHLFIGEDCSTDRTAEIVREYAEKYPDKITAMINQKNIGIVRNNVNVISHCTAPYVALLEGDDYWTDPYKLQKQVDYLESNPEYGVVHTDVDLFNESNSSLVKNFNKTNNISFPSGSIFKDLLTDHKLFIKTATIVARTDIYKASFHPDLILERNWLQGDLTWCLEMAYRTRVKYLDDSTATYRLLAESASRTKDYIKRFRLHESVSDIRYYYWKLYSGDQKIKRILDSHVSKTYLHDAYLLKDWDLVTKAKEQFRNNNIPMSIKDRIKISYVFLVKNKIIK